MMVSEGDALLVLAVHCRGSFVQIQSIPSMSFGQWATGLGC
jgi:hypothetical protein